ncbi:hypothetical protein H8356DRAFT_1355034 [Neocallimastix lanati (nom. inval.)]|nr:hypothetical protein H8356DRAFT_1355034 [Neocallimastix sp. JGI-2020a]
MCDITTNALVYLKLLTKSTSIIYFDNNGSVSSKLVGFVNIIEQVLWLFIELSKLYHLYEIIAASIIKINIQVFMTNICSKPCVKMIYAAPLRSLLALLACLREQHCVTGLAGVFGASENIDLSIHGFEHIFVIKTCMFILIIEAYIKYVLRLNISNICSHCCYQSSEMMMILYDDQEEICKKNGDLCELYKDIQSITRHVSKIKDYTSSSNRI